MGSQEFKTGAFKNQLNNEQNFNLETMSKGHTSPNTNLAEIIIEERDPQEETEQLTVDQTAQFEM